MRNFQNNFTMSIILTYNSLYMLDNIYLVMLIYIIVKDSKVFSYIQFFVFFFCDFKLNKEVFNACFAGLNPEQITYLVTTQSSEN